MGAVDNENIASMSSFENNRVNTKLNLALKAGFIAGGLTGSGADVGVYLNKDLILGAEYLQGKDNLKDQGSVITMGRVDKSTVQSQVYGVYAKYFTGPTFAITSGIYHRSI